VLVDFKSQIKYSYVSFELSDYTGSEIDGTSYLTDRNGNPKVFNLNRNEDGLWLNNNWAKPDNKWNPKNQFVFSLRKYCLFPALSGVFLLWSVKAFLGAYISSDEYAKNHLERLQETAQSMSLPALQHLAFIKRGIFPIRDMNLKSKPGKSQKIGYTDTEYREFLKRTMAISHDYNTWHDAQKQQVTKEFNRNTTAETKRAYDLIGAVEEKRRLQYSEYWSEYNSRGIFKQGNDPSIGTFGGGSGTVQYLTEFGERLLEYVEAVSLED